MVIVRNNGVSEPAQKRTRLKSFDEAKVCLVKLTKSSRKQQAAVWLKN